MVGGKLSKLNSAFTLTVVVSALLGCSKPAAIKNGFEGSIGYDRITLTNPTYEQIDEAFRSLKWDDPNQLPQFWIGDLRITRWFDATESGIEEFERSHRMVAVWRPESKPAFQCQLEGVEQAHKLVMAVAHKEDISNMLDWFDY